jgi:4,5-DOPA dioxygenase extradiol
MGSLSHTGKKMPVLFVGHGSPVNMVLSNGFTRHLADLGREIPRPSAILVISAHWLTRGTFVSCEERPRLIYDFYGFPKELYQVQYRCEGSPEIAELIIHTVSGERIIRCSQNRGLDHASYSILTHMYPKADIPVLEMSLDYSVNEQNPKPIQYHFELGKKLRSLRETGVLIIGSGNIVHNLRGVDFSDMDAAPFDWAREADDTIAAYLMEGDYQALMNYPFAGESAFRAVPTLDHYLPMIYALSLLEEEKESISFTYEGFQNGSIAMRSFRIG